MAQTYATRRVNIGETEVAIPMDQQAVFRQEVFAAILNQSASATLNSDAVDMVSLRRITGRVLSSHTGTINVQASHDGTTWDTAFTSAVAANTPVFFDVIAHLRFMRIQYVNGGTTTTTFRLHAYAGAA